MNANEAILSQYLAALEMLKQAVSQCPPLRWNDPSDKNKSWHIAYHALFFTHLYAQVSIDEFKSWAHHRPDAESLGKPLDPPYTPVEVLAYLDFCAQDLQAKLPLTNLEAESSGFHWLPFGKLELQIYNIRHLQHHAAELMERLGEQEGIELPWIGKQPV
jgi:hypothetical protein